MLAPSSPPADEPTASAEDKPLYLSPHDAWEAMYADCEQATTSIHFEQYIIANDAVGQRFFALFIAKAKAGIKVRLILDAVGSRHIDNSKLPAELRAAGGEILFFNPKNLMHLFSPGSWFPRNHAKTLIIDSRIAYVGSVCLDATMKDWRDLHLRLEDEVVADISADFSHLWRQIQTYRRRRQRYRTAPPPPDFNHVTRYVVHRPEMKVNLLYREMLTEIGTAKSHIRLATPYFVPPLRLRVALRSARRRGVEVTLLLSEHTDVAIADRVGRSFFPRLVKAGIQLRLYEPTIMHAKYIIVDDRWATIGSTNLDYLSLIRNRETNLVTRDEKIITLLTNQFENDLTACTVGTVESWTEQSWLYRLVGRMGRAIRHVL